MDVLKEMLLWELLVVLPTVLVRFAGGWAGLAGH